MSSNNMSVEELRTLYNLLDRYNKQQSKKYDWWDVDTYDFVLNEIDDSAGGILAPKEEDE
jgi:hypothetical protein